MTWEDILKTNNKSMKEKEEELREIERRHHAQKLDRMRTETGRNPYHLGGHNDSMFVMNLKQAISNIAELEKEHPKPLNRKEIKKILDRMPEYFGFDFRKKLILQANGNKLTLEEWREVYDKYKKEHKARMKLFDEEEARFEYFYGDEARQAQEDYKTR
tara:strand:- start:53 stop:529 length:477 start_codon:yes stop_codon:yes gene_type:complete